MKVYFSDIAIVVLSIILVYYIITVQPSPEPKIIFIASKRDTVQIHKYDSLIINNNNTIVKYQERIKENKDKVNENIKNFTTDITADSIIRSWRTINL
jgi:hypothetical protein